MRRSVAANSRESTAISAESLNVKLKSDCGVPNTRITQNPESKIQKMISGGIRVSSESQ
jgi:hypothetical protein